jgi:hypothetical protein
LVTESNVGTASSSVAGPFYTRRYPDYLIIRDACRLLDPFGEQFGVALRPLQRSEALVNVVVNPNDNGPVFGGQPHRSETRRHPADENGLAEAVIGIEGVLARAFALHIALDWLAIRALQTNPLAVAKFAARIKL